MLEMPPPLLAGRRCRVETNTRVFFPEFSPTLSCAFRIRAGVSLRGGPQRQLRVPGSRAPSEEEESAGPAGSGLAAPSAEGLQAGFPHGAQSFQPSGGSRVCHPDPGDTGHAVSAGSPAGGLLLLSRLLTLAPKFLGGSFHLRRLGEYSCCHPL